MLDIKKKYCMIYQDFAGLKKSDFGVFWSLKRSHACDEEIFNILNLNKCLEEFKIEKRANIETEYYLNFDTLFSGIKEFLQNFSINNSLYIVTARNDYFATKNQLEKLEIFPYFKRIICAGSIDNPNIANSKYKALSEVTNIKPSFVIGDSEADYELAQKLGSDHIATLSGIRNYKMLKDCGSTKFIISVSSLTDKN